MSESIAVKFLGHTSVLIKHGADSLAIDPVLSKTVLGQARTSEAVFDPAEIAQVSSVLVSNIRNHRFDLSSFKYFRQRATEVIVPHGCATALERFYHFAIKEARPGEAITSGSLKISPASSGHTASRLFAWNAAGSHYLIQSESVSIVYVSDASDSPSVFETLGHGRQIDLAIVPIGRASPKWWPGRFLTPEGAARAAAALGATKILPVAHDAFLSSGSISTELLDRLRQEGQKLGIAERITPLKAGETLEVTHAKN